MVSRWVVGVGNRSKEFVRFCVYVFFWVVYSSFKRFEFKVIMVCELGIVIII